MKRSTALTSLSRDHQHALDVALRLRRTDALTVEDAAARFVAFFDVEGRRHFNVEEEVVLPAVSAHDPAWAECVQRIRVDHQTIRVGAREMAALDLLEDPVASAQALGECLRDHVRFEERVLFPILERRLDAAELELLGSAIRTAEST